MSGHSDLPPSGADSWRICALWVAMNKAFPQEDTEESREGHAAHWVCWERLAGRQVAEGSFCPNGVVATGEMLDGAELMVDVIRRMLPAGVVLHVEEPIAIPSVHAQCWGTPDVWFFIPSLYTLHVIDYKFGHRFVDEFENYQGVSYISGICDKLAAEYGHPPGQFDRMVQVNFTVVQPRCFYKGSPVRMWSTTASDLRAYVNQLANAARVALGENPPAKTCDGCRDCVGRHACQTLQQAAYSDAEFSGKSTPLQLPAAAASLELRMLERAAERLSARVEGLRAQVTAYAKQGQVVPFHRLEQGYGRTQWTLPPAQVIEVGKLMGVDLSKPGVLTPKQAKTAGVDEAVISAYSMTPAGAIKLLPCTPADARRVFGVTA